MKARLNRLGIDSFIVYVKRFRVMGFRARGRGRSLCRTKGG